MENNIHSQCIEWGNNILSIYAPDWKIEWSQGSPEGIAIFKTKTIYVRWMVPDYALLAHEIAHAVRGKIGGHDSEFAHAYMKLVREHFNPIINV